MHFTGENLIFAALGMLLGFIICRLTRTMYTMRDPTGPKNPTP